MLFSTLSSSLCTNPILQPGSGVKVNCVAYDNQSVLLQNIIYYILRVMCLFFYKTFKGTHIDVGVTVYAEVTSLHRETNADKSQISIDCNIFLSLFDFLEIQRIFVLFFVYRTVIHYDPFVRTLGNQYFNVPYLRLMLCCLQRVIRDPSYSHFIFYHYCYYYIRILRALTFQIVLYNMRSYLVIIFRPKLYRRCQLAVENRIDTI